MIVVASVIVLVHVIVFVIVIVVVSCCVMLCCEVLCCVVLCCSLFMGCSTSGVWAVCFVRWLGVCVCDCVCARWFVVSMIGFD